MMRKLAMIMALASTALATPALARDKAWYVGVEGGAMIVEDIDWDIAGSTTSLTGTGTTDSKYGWDVDGIIGYDFGAFRLETEVGYRRASVDSFRTTAGVPISGTLYDLMFDTAPLAELIQKTVADPEGEAKTISFAGGAE